MSLPVETLDELQLLALYDPASSRAGLKVHSHSASPAMVAAAERLHAKRLVTQPDGGYLTELGRDAAEHLREVLDILAS